MRRHSILIVDDETNIVQAILRLLRNEGYTVVAAHAPGQAKELLRHQTFSLIVTDYRMPEMTGLELLKETKEFYPDTLRIILTGYADVDLVMKAINEGEVYRFLVKPWNDAEFKVVVRQALAHFDLLMDNKILLQMVQKQKETIAELQKKYPDAMDLPKIKDGAYVIETPGESLEDFMKRYFPKI